MLSSTISFPEGNCQARELPLLDLSFRLFLIAAQASADDAAGPSSLEMNFGACASSLERRPSVQRSSLERIDTPCRRH
jgi:hypothetical protein